MSQVVVSLASNESLSPESLSSPSPALSRMSTVTLSASSFAHGLSGCLGSVLAMSLLYPLDNIRTRLQVQPGAPSVALSTLPSTSALSLPSSHLSSSSASTYTGSWDCAVRVIEREGVAGLYRGVGSALFGVGLSSAVYFFWYDVFKSITMASHARASPPSSTPPSLTALQNIVVASSAGVLNVLATLPIWVINTRLSIGSSPTLMRCIADIFSADGLGGFYAGFLPSMVLVTNPAIQFVVYEQLLRVLKNRAVLSSSSTESMSSPVAPSSLQYFLVGAFAKAVATFLTYPSQVLKSRMQARSDVSLHQVMQDMWNAPNFPRELYRGMNAKMAATVLNAAFTFMVYERLSRALIRIINTWGQAKALTV